MLPGHLKVLVVDDFKLARSVSVNALNALGVTKVTEVESAQLAMAKLEAAAAEGAPYDVVLSDWHMPNETGFDLLVKIRAHDALKKVIFILVSAETEMDCIVQALQAGANDFIGKPTDESVFDKKISRALAKVAQAA